MHWAPYPKRQRPDTAGKPSRELVELVLLEALSSECHRLHTMDEWYRQRDPYATTLGLIGHIDESWWDILGLRALGRKFGPLVRAGLVRKEEVDVRPVQVPAHRARRRTDPPADRPADRPRRARAVTDWDTVNL